MTNETQEYTFSVFYETNPEGGYVAYVPALPGCFAEGKDKKETEENIAEEIELHLKDLQKEGENIPKDVESLQGIVMVTV